MTLPVFSHERVAPRPLLCPPSSVTMTHQQLAAWCARVDELRRDAPGLSEATYLYRLGLGPHDPRASQIIRAMEAR